MNSYSFNNAKCDSVSLSVVVTVRLTEMDEARVPARARVTIVPAPES